jgi:hypothetical protein
MILSDMRRYLKLNGRAAVHDLSIHFDSDPEAIRGMLSELERRGMVRRLPVGTLCGGGCRQCKPESVELYEWCG